MPSWAKDKGFKPVINARAETATEKPMFRHALSGNRCLVLADGFYEWNVLEKADKALLTFAILTTVPNDLMKDIHNRMPVILPAAAEAAWLDPTKDAGDVKDLLQPYSADEMTAYPVSKKVNIPSIDVPELINPLYSISIRIIQAVWEFSGLVRSVVTATLDK